MMRNMQQQQQSVSVAVASKNLVEMVITNHIILYSLDCRRILKMQGWWRHGICGHDTIAMYNMA